MLIFIHWLEIWASLLLFCVLVMEKCFQNLLFQVREQKPPQNPCLVHCSGFTCSFSTLPSSSSAGWIISLLSGAEVCVYWAFCCWPLNVFITFGSFLLNLSIALSRTAGPIHQQKRIPYFNTGAPKCICFNEQMQKSQVFPYTSFSKIFFLILVWVEPGLIFTSIFIENKNKSFFSLPVL